ncbi:MAG TPA: hypothetical protein VGW30_03940 [Gaiellaceae bacterium]|nr:hypothetical protein [Gaiellaceae bacterium]
MSTAVTTRRRRKRSAGVLGWVLRLAAVVIVFGVGVAVGQALEDRPEPAKPVTSFRTIQPWTQTNRVTETRTVTVTP